MMVKKRAEADVIPTLRVHNYYLLFVIKLQKTIVNVLYYSLKDLSDLTNLKCIGGKLKIIKLYTFILLSP